MKIKFCGLKTVEDYLCAWELGVDYVGFVCYEKSPRYIQPQKIVEVLEGARKSQRNLKYAEPKLVGLFVDWSPQQVLDAVAQVGFDIAQIYNNDMANYLPIPYWKVFHISKASDMEDLDIIKKECIKETNMVGLILDTKIEKSHAENEVLGGSGISFNWDYLNMIDLNIPYFVAGGININNIADIVDRKPYGIDISSGLETERGIKDHKLMYDIMMQVRKGADK